MKKITVSILTTLLMLSMVFSSSVFAANEETSAWDSFLGLFSAKASADDVGVEYRGHVQNKGDFPTDGSWIQGPNQLGTVGESLRLEAFWIKLTDAPEGLHIKYEVHVQNRGWMAPVEDGKLAGTQAEALRIEAIKIALVDDAGVASKDYSVSYKGHVQNIGDTAWFKDGAQLGTTGSNLRLEALEVKIEKIAPDLTDYEAALAAVTEANYTKASWATYQDVVEDNVMTEDNVQSEVDAATAIILDAQEDLVTVPVIAGMTATAQKQITVTGTQLDKLSASMLAVAGNTVTKVEVNAAGTSAVVTLGTDLVPDTNTKVTATIDGTAKEYTVKYSIAAVTVAIQAATYDDDKAGQALTVLVDGVATTPDYLQAQGYTVTFAAFDSTGASATSTLLASTTAGTIKVPQSAEADYTAQVTIVKGSSIVTSAKAVIKIRDLDNNADAISAYTLKNTKPTNPVTMKSTTLVTSDTAQFTDVTVGYGDAAAVLTSGYKVTSSNSAVISVNAAGVMTANGIGTADITITVGTATKTVTLTVANEARKATTVALKDATTFTYIIGNSNAATVVVKDQYGDPFSGTPSVTFTGPSITNIVTSPTGTTGLGSTTGNGKGETTITFTASPGTPDDAKTGIVVFRNSDNAVIGSFNVVTSVQNTIQSKKLEYTATSESKDDTINTDLSNKDSISYKVGGYNINGVYTGDVTPLTGYTVTFNKDIVSVVGSNGTTAVNGVLTLTSNDNYFTVTGLKAGSTTLQVKDSMQNVVPDTKTVTVLKGAPYITAISFKTPSTVTNIATGAVKYTNVLDVTDMAADDIVNGITLSTASVYKVRIVETALTVPVVPAGTLYLDKNDNGAYNDGTDTILGNLAAVHYAESGVWNITPPINVITGVTTAAGMKGTVTFTLYDTVSKPGTSVAVGPKAVTVNVPSTESNAVALAADKAALTITPTGAETYSAIKGNVTPSVLDGASATNGSDVTWVSSDPTTVSIAGTVTRPIYSAGDKTVTLTATLTNGTSTDTKVFTLVVSKKNFTATANSPADDKFDIVGDGYATGDFTAVANIDMNTAVAGIDNTVQINGVTYSVAYAAGTATVSISAGTATDDAVATTNTIAVIKDGKTVNLTLNIDAVSSGGTPTFTIS